MEPEPSQASSPVSAGAPPAMPPGQPLRCLYSAHRRQGDVFYLWSNRDTLVEKRNTKAAVFPHLSILPGKKCYSSCPVLSFSRSGRPRILLVVTRILTHLPITNAGCEVRGGIGKLVTGEQSPAWKTGLLGALTLAPTLCESRSTTVWHTALLLPWGGEEERSSGQFCI